MKRIESAELRLGPKKLIKEGDMIRVSGGPYYKLPDGKRISMATTGTFRFVRHVQRGKRSWIEAWGKHGYAVLNIGKRFRSSESPSYINAPYRVSKVRPEKEKSQ